MLPAKEHNTKRIMESFRREKRFISSARLLLQPRLVPESLAHTAAHSYLHRENQHLRVERPTRASQKVRAESLPGNAEFDAIETDPDA